MSFVLTSSRAPGVLSASTTIAASPAFEVRREAIDWRWRAPGALEIELTIRNPSMRTTAPTHAIVRSAAFGAFVPQRPLTVLAVPAIAPRGRVTLTAVAPTSLLARPDERPNLEAPRSDETEQLVRELERELELISETGRRFDRAELERWVAWTRARKPLAAPGVVHWMGNLHIFVGGTAAERHQARGVVVRRGFTTLVPFEVGDGHADAYRFRLDGDASQWEPALVDSCDDGRDLPFARGRRSDEGHEWFEAGMAWLRLSVRPPESAAAGRSELHVQRRSTGQTTVVEFELDPR